MLISSQQLAANRQNAQHSTGPQTPAGKAAVRLNALTYGLRARSLLIPGEDPADYQQLWDGLQTDWQPQGRTQRLLLEQMATSQWLLARMAAGESRVYQHVLPAEKQLALLERISMQRARLERSFANAIRILERLQHKRQASAALPRKPVETAQAAQPATVAQAAQAAQAAPAAQPAQAAQPELPHPGYRMADGAPRPAFCSPLAPDTR